MVSEIISEFGSIFYPKSHAVIGASADARKFGGRFLKAQVVFGYPGKLYPVNPQETEILGLKTYANVGDIPGPVDFATITVPARFVPDVLDECLAKGIKSVQILSAGFKEIGEEGQKLEARLVRTASHGMRLIGPNCFGVYSPGGGVTIMPGADLPRETGPVGLISQSGGYTFRIIRRSSGFGIRFSKAVSFGNACNTSESDILEYLGADPETKIIMAYIEGVKDGHRFLKLLKEVSRNKPVILWKAGLTPGGTRAVHSHTGALSGGEAVWNAIFKQTNAVMVNSLEELIDTTLGFLHLAPYRARNISVVGGGGGVSVTAADTCERAGMRVNPFSKEVQQKLLGLVPPAGASVRNPIDIGNPFPTPNMLRSVLQIVLTEGNADAVIIDNIQVYPLKPGADQGDTLFGVDLDELARVPVEVKRRLGKPVVMVMSVEANEADAIAVESLRRNVRDYYLREGIPVFLSLEQAAKVMARLSGYYEGLEATRPISRVASVLA